jgi:hypothetical protein
MICIGRIFIGGLDRQQCRRVILCANIYICKYNLSRKKGFR